VLYISTITRMLSLKPYTWPGYVPHLICICSKISCTNKWKRILDS